MTCDCRCCGALSEDQCEWVLRTCGADGASQHDFRWPLTEGATVECPDWDDDDQRTCGGGLHGLPWGIGDGDLLDWDLTARWLVVEVDIGAGCVGSAGKCRFRRGIVRHVGDRYSATSYIVGAGPRPEGSAQLPRGLERLAALRILATTWLALVVL